MGANETAAPPAVEAPEDRHEAISEILRELRGDSDPAPSPEATPPGPPAEEPQTPAAQPVGGEQDEAASTPVAGPPASQSLPELAPRLSAARRTPTADPQPAPQTSTPRTLILLHAFLLVIFAAGTWLTYCQVSRTLSAIAADMRDRPTAQAPVGKAGDAGGRPEAGGARPEGISSSASPSPLAPRPSSPVRRSGSPLGDDGLRYIQEVEKGDLLFQKELYREAAAAYQRATEVVPLDFNDGAAAFHVGECYLRLKDAPRAIAAFESVTTAYPSLFQPKALYQLGLLHMDLRAYPKAREAFYALLLRRARYGPETAPLIEEATYRVADTYWLEAEAVAEARGQGRGARDEGGRESVREWESGSAKAVGTRQSAVGSEEKKSQTPGAASTADCLVPPADCALPPADCPLPHDSKKGAE